MNEKYATGYSTMKMLIDAGVPGGLCKAINETDQQYIEGAIRAIRDALAENRVRKQLEVDKQ